MRSTSDKSTETVERCVSTLRAVGTRIDADGLDSVRALASRDHLIGAVVNYLGLREVTGWAAANRRGRAQERMLLLLSHRLRTLAGVDEPLELLLRGSGGQGMPAIHSDIDFELSGPSHPRGHRPLERAIEVTLAGFGIDAEGSSGRPTAIDLEGSEGEHRELHEWIELRRAGSPARDQGWVAPRFDALPDDWWRRRSAYEREGRRATPKYAFFESRALIARLALLHGTAAGTTQTQLRALRHLGLRRHVHRLEETLAASLELYELPGESPRRLDVTQRALARLRAELDLPGPDLRRDESPDSRRIPPSLLGPLP